jgi:DNA polymerase-3 subunit epsilon
VRDKPRFAEIAADLLKFLGKAPLIAHNAPFDHDFLNAEFEKAGLPRLDPERFIDTLALARKRFPRSPNTLDALCQRFGVDASARARHEALVDCALTAFVYVGLTSRATKRPSPGWRLVGAPLT